MPSGKGLVVLMGSGELTATMVEVHKELLKGLGNSPQAVFIDTPAGFQLNVDQLSQKAVEYFRSRVQRPLSVISFKSSETITPYAAEQAFHSLRKSDFIMIGPGSPTYAVRQWQQTPIPDIMKKRVAEGGCLVAASAAALTAGCFTLPVYEIYKVGEALHWVEGMDILGHFGFNLVVIPHWNNAEGGTHDTRFCYMGKPRFKKLESRLPEDVSILGLDEHTACIIDLEKEEVRIRGIGRVILRKGGAETSFERGGCYPLDVLRGGYAEKKGQQMDAAPIDSVKEEGTGEDAFWDNVHKIERAFQDGLEKNVPEDAASALLEMDGTIWKAQQELENAEFISQARDILRDMLAFLGTRLSSSPKSEAECLAPIVEQLLDLRERFRKQKKWQEADEVRKCLSQVNIVIEDTKEGSRWRLKP